MKPVFTRPWLERGGSDWPKVQASSKKRTELGFSLAEVEGRGQGLN